MGPTWCRVMLIFIRIRLSHCCVMGLVSQSCGLCLFVDCYLIMSCCSPWPLLMHGVVLVHCCVLDWLTDVCACWCLVMGPLCWRVTHQCVPWLVRLHGTLYRMTDLYYYLYNWLLSSAMTPLPAATVLGSRYYSHLFNNCFIWCLSYYLCYLDHGASGSRCYTQANVALSNMYK